MIKQTNIHGVSYTIELINPDRCMVVKHTSKKDKIAYTDNLEAWQYIDKPDDIYNHLDAKRHLKGLFLT